VIAHLQRSGLGPIRWVDCALFKFRVVQPKEWSQHAQSARCDPTLHYRFDVNDGAVVGVARYKVLVVSRQSSRKTMTTMNVSIKLEHAPAAVWRACGMPFKLFPISFAA
jgi:hypothetical protein